MNALLRNNKLSSLSKNQIKKQLYKEASIKYK